MSIPVRLLPITVDWLEPGTTVDAYGNIIDDWTAPTTAELQVMIEQRRTVEHRDDRDVTISGLVLFTNELAVTARARFGWEGRTYEVDGEPAVLYSPAGPHHAEIPLKLVV